MSATLLATVNASPEQPKIKPISGSWFEFQHHATVEGVDWNPALANFTCDQWELKIKEIAETIIRMTGSKSTLINKPLPKDDPKQRKPDITLARTKLGWEPKVALEQGLVTTLEYFRTKVR